MNLTPTIEKDGNDIEKQSWPILKARFRSYEEFWGLHIVPLRSAGGKQMRRGVDPALELIAMLHYSCYVNLWRANKKAQEQGELRFFQEIYANLGTSCELAEELVENFRKLCQKCDVKFAAGPGLKETLKEFRRENLMKYRNLLHAPLSGYRQGPDDAMLVPKKEKLSNANNRRRLRWSETYDFADSDFVRVDVEYEADFSGLCNALEHCWREMLDVTPQLRQTETYKQEIESGESVPLPTHGRPAPTSIDSRAEMSPDSQPEVTFKKLFE